MNTREMARRQELCQTLNMNFDEANELFSTETLSSMTMAKVNGGAWVLVALTATAAIVGIAAGLIQIYEWSKDDDGSTKPANPITIDKDGIPHLTGTNIRVNSMKVVNGQAYYWASGPQTPTPTPTSVWRPPMPM